MACKELGKSHVA